jgi:hypothetical protein
LASNSRNSAEAVKHLIIFDFDGVLADSEIVANTVLADFVSELGVPTTPDDAIRTYMGKRFPEVIAAIETAIGRPLPDEFPAELQDRTGPPEGCWRASCSGELCTSGGDHAGYRSVNRQDQPFAAMKIDKAKPVRWCSAWSMPISHQNH